MNDHIETGQQGEEIAEAYLVQEGYSILSRHFRHERAEIDLIAIDTDELVFIEVKTRKNTEEIDPATAVTAQKQEHLARAAEAYIHQNRLQDDIARFDVIAVGLDDPKTPNIQHLIDAFRIEVSP